MSDQLDDIRGDTAAIYGGGINEGASTSNPPSEPAGDDSGSVVRVCKSCMISQVDCGSTCRKCGSTLVPIRPVRDSYVGDVIDDTYELVEQIGAGGMGEVYLGVNRSLGQHVAVKFLSREYAADETLVMRFLNEARSYGQVNHPNAVTLLDYGQHDDGALYIMTEYVEGKSLTEVVRTHSGLSPDQVISVATQCCEVLTAAHDRGIIHRDLKPENLMLVPGGGGRFTVKVLDFGIAKIADEDQAPLTETGAIFGTPEFMSPEQASGMDVDPRSDIYALGVIMFYALTGRLPFQGESQFSILNKQVNTPPPPPSQIVGQREVPPHLEALILKCMNKDPDARYDSATALAEALDDVTPSRERTSSDDAEAETPLELESSSDTSKPTSPDPLAAHRGSHPPASSDGPGAERPTGVELDEADARKNGPVPIDFDDGERDQMQWLGLAMAAAFSIAVAAWAFVPSGLASDTETSSSSTAERVESSASTPGRGESGAQAGDESQATASDTAAEASSDGAHDSDEESQGSKQANAGAPPDRSDDRNDSTRAASEESPSPEPSSSNPPPSESPGDEDDSPASEEGDPSSESDDEAIPEGMALPPKQIE